MNRAVMATASELLEARHYPGVVALITDALEGEPDCVPLLLVRARAHMALRRDLEAQADLRDIIRLDPQNSRAYCLLGELAARRNENDSASIFFAEALRLDPADREAETWLAIVQCTAGPAAVAHKPRVAKGTSSPDDERPTARFTGQRPAPRAATVRQTDRDIEALPAPPELRFATGSSPVLEPYRPEPVQLPLMAYPRHAGVFQAYPAESHTHDAEEVTNRVPRHGAVAQPTRVPSEPAPRRAPSEPASFARGSERHVEQAPLHLRAAPRAPSHPSEAEQPTLQGAQPVRRPLSSPSPSSLSSPAQHARGPIPERPGFGDYLVSTGILTRERLRAAQAYQRSMKVQLATAIVTLGLASPQRIEWAAVAHQSQLGRNG